MAVILKPLKDAACRDNIRAVVRHAGVNQDGGASGITLLSGQAQEALSRRLYREAGLNPLDTGYTESHGTGTQVGDPIEARALSNVFSTDRLVDNPVIVGSLKINIGRAEGADGIFRVIKTALMLENLIILTYRNFKTANKRIPL